MYLDDCIKIVKKNFIFILTITILGAFTAFMSTSFIKSGYNTQQTMFLSVEKTNPNVIESIDLHALTDTAIALISSQDFQQSVDAAGATSQAKKLAPQVLVISTTSPSKQITKSAHDQIISLFNSRASELIKNAKVELIPTGKAADPTKKIFNSKILAGFGALIGFAISLTIISISRYFKV